MPSPPNQIIEFGPFRLDRAERVLLRDGQAVPMTLKTFDVLLMLVENSGHIVEKDELMNRVWAGSFVEEGNLKVTVSMLRKALGEDQASSPYIETVPRRGYRFVASVKAVAADGVELVMRQRTRESLTIEEETAVTVRSSSLRLPFLLAGALLVVLVAVGGFFFLRKQTQPSPATISAAPIRSIAVLPFKPLAADGRDESLELGMAETLITRLSGLKEVIVRPMSAVRKYNGLEQDAITAGRDQRVDAVLDGSLQRRGDRIRVTMRLVRVADSRTLWIESFDENFTDIFSVQDRVSERVAGVLTTRLGDQEQDRLVKRYTQQPEAYQLYLRGRYFWAKMTPSGLKKSIEFYNKAIKLDPTYALAYVGLADSYNFLGSSGAIPLKESHPMARAAATKALELDDQLAEAHASLAAITMDYYWDWPEAERQFKRAIELNANYSTAHRWYSQYLSLMGRADQAIAEAQKGVEIDPQSLGENNNVALAFYRARQYDKSIECSRKTVEMDPNFVPAHIMLGLAFEQKGMSEQSIAEFEKGRELSGNSPSLRALLAYSYARAGRTNDAQQIVADLDHFSAQHYVSPMDMAGMHIGLSEHDKAFGWLEKSYQDRIPLLGYLKVEPLFDPLRSDPRFTDLVRRVGLAP